MFEKDKCPYFADGRVLFVGAAFDDHDRKTVVPFHRPEGQFVEHAALLEVFQDEIPMSVEVAFEVLERHKCIEIFPPGEFFAARYHFEAKPRG